MIDGNSNIIDLYCEEEMLPSSIDDDTNSEFSMESSRKRKKLLSGDSESDQDEAVEIQEEPRTSLQKHRNKYGGINHQPQLGSTDGVLDLRIQSSSRLNNRSTSILKLEITDDDMSSVSDSEDYFSGNRMRFLRRYRTGHILALSRSESYASHQMTKVNDVHIMGLNREESLRCNLTSKPQDQSSSSVPIDLRKQKCDERSSSESDDDFADRVTPIARTRRATNIARQRSVQQSAVDASDENCEASVVIEERPKLNFHASLQLQPIENPNDALGECPICYSGFTDQNIATPASCFHNFCSGCLQMWAKNVNTCPLDRSVFNMIYVRKFMYGTIIERIPVENRDLDTGEETDSDASFCEVCGRNSSQERLIVCDCCGRMYHLACISPPVTNVPVSDWYCSDCSRFE